MDIKQMTHVGRMPVRFNDDYGIVYFMDAHTCIVIPMGCDSTVVELAVRQYIRGMYLAYYRIVHSCRIPGVEGENVGYEYQLIKKAFEDCNATPP